MLKMVKPTRARTRTLETSLSFVPLTPYSYCNLNIDILASLNNYTMFNHSLLMTPSNCPLTLLSYHPLMMKLGRRPLTLLSRRPLTLPSCPPPPPAGAAQPEPLLSADRPLQQNADIDGTVMDLSLPDLQLTSLIGSTTTSPSSVVTRVPTLTQVDTQVGSPTYNTYDHDRLVGKVLKLERHIEIIVSSPQLSSHPNPNNISPSSNLYFDPGTNSTAYSNLRPNPSLSLASFSLMIITDSRTSLDHSSASWHSLIKTPSNSFTQIPKVVLLSDLNPLTPTP
ncbi:hypothetical protein Pcinc_003491 [Petrolisthes cinctipes]|uniref:Uncharacterized protein n=1 Tax=Petrolisthes cinctipes TaxID=88211 RepID=A0AAE1GJA9_PETCI|nr:hypothetical protein Pcinc_003491 [Petrolisthes cinctipes]